MTIFSLFSLTSSSLALTVLALLATLRGASAGDQPDLCFLDTNCDGIDGDVDKGIFVSSLGK